MWVVSVIHDEHKLSFASDETAIVLVSGSHKKKTARRARASCPRIE